MQAVSTVVKPIGLRLVRLDSSIAECKQSVKRGRAASMYREGAKIYSGACRKWSFPRCNSERKKILSHTTKPLYENTKSNHNRLNKRNFLATFGTSISPSFELSPPHNPLRDSDASQKSPLCNRPSAKVVPSSAVTENSMIAHGPHRVKSSSVISRHHEVAGEDWKVFEAINYIIGLHTRFSTFLAKSKLRYLRIIVTLLALIGYLLTYIIFLAKKYVADNTELTIVIMGLNGACLLLFILESYHTLRSNFVSIGFTFLCIIVQAYYYGISIFAAVALISDHLTSVGLVYLLTAYIVDTVTAIRFTLLFISCPILMVTFFLELVVRAVLCRMGCSYTVLVKCNYTYGLYQLANLPCTCLLYTSPSPRD
eukprot:TRINITY_DN5766_c0_g1_i1.p1 TRINITY_DN5766_c0_g1~~TRINITY_DN5766_c0_g1_i1.p1  ORF type:complete len:368 (-),score=24.95 TRINITY_DN5766_c0_g1_i1:53-1156(-)